MTHTIEVPQDVDSTLTLTLDTQYRLNTRAWQDWHGNSVDTVASSSDGFYPEGTEVRLLAVGRPPATFIGWNGAVSGRDPASMVVMDDGQLAEAAFALDATELQSGVPVHVSLRWQGTGLEFHELDFERYYVLMPPDASELEVRFDTRSATPGAGAGLWVAGQDLWPGWVRSSETANRILRDGVATVSLRRSRDRWPAAYTILVRAAESDDAGTRTLEGTLVATVSRGAAANRAPQAVGALENRTLETGGAALVIDVARAFSDPDGDALTYAAVSSSETVARATAWGSTVTVTPEAAGVATIAVTATDVSGSNRTATQVFVACVVPNGMSTTEYQRYLETWDALSGGSSGPGCRGTPRLTFTDHPIRPGTTPVRAIHFLELRRHITELRGRAGLPVVQWVDPILTAGVTAVRGVHLTELRDALDEAYDAKGRSRPRWTDPMLMVGKTGIKAVHIMELRAAVVALETGG